MNFEFSEEQEHLRESVRRFLREQAPMSYVRSMLDDPLGTTSDVWQGLARLGVTGLLVPERDGGAGMGMTDMGVVLEELGRTVHPGPFLSSAVGAVCTLVALGHDSLLAGLGDGSVVATLALHDERGSATVANHGVLTGTKPLVPDARAADVLLVTARDHDALGVYAVDAAVDVEDAASPDGTRKLSTVRFD